MVGSIFHPPEGKEYKWYILPIGRLYATYHLLGEPETTILIYWRQKKTKNTTKFRGDLEKALPLWSWSRPNCYLLVVFSKNPCSIDHPKRPATLFGRLDFQDEFLFRFYLWKFSCFLIRDSLVIFFKPKTWFENFVIFVGSITWRFCRNSCWKQWIPCFFG